jgi:hypothetical protein
VLRFDVSAEEVYLDKRLEDAVLPRREPDSGLVCDVTWLSLAERGFRCNEDSTNEELNEDVPRSELLRLLWVSKEEDFNNELFSSVFSTNGFFSLTDDLVVSGFLFLSMETPLIPVDSLLSKPVLNKLDF